MACYAAIHWALGSALRSHWNWVAWLGLNGLWLTWSPFFPGAIDTDSGRIQEHIYDVAFLAAVVGAIAGLRWLSKGNGLFCSLGRTERFTAELGGLFAITGLSVGLVTLPALLVQEEGGRRLLSQALALAPPIVHMAAVAALMSRAPTSNGLRVALLVAVCWWIPSALAGTEGWTAVLAAVLEGPWRLASIQSWVETPLVALVDMAPAGAAALAAWLLDPRVLHSR